MQGEGEGEGPPKGASVVGEPGADEVLESMRARVAEAARGFGDKERVGALLAEAAPFVEAARRAGGAPDAHSMAWREARSLAWLLGYRLGDQGAPVAVATAVSPAWRDAASVSVSVGDEVAALVLDGFARGREDRSKLETHAALAAAMPVVELGAGVVAAFAAGALDADGARALADRASSKALRSDAKYVVLDVSGLASPSAAVLAELWSLAGSAKMLGVGFYVSGLQGAAREILEAAGVTGEGETRVESVREALAQIAAQSSPANSPAGEAGVGRIVAWVRKVFARGE